MAEIPPRPSLLVRLRDPRDGEIYSEHERLFSKTHDYHVGVLS